MKNTLLLILFLLLLNCSKPKTVLICGDHVCVNKTEAEQYFEENLSIEVKIIDNKKKKEIDLIELNLNEDFKNDKKITLLSKNTTNKKLKSLSSEEVTEIKQNIKKKKNKKKIVKKIIKKDKEIKKNKVVKKTKFKSDNEEITRIKGNNKLKDTVDVCTILKKCSIDEISKYLLKQGKDKDFPDITTRQ